jgi:hypothetical protein
LGREDGIETDHPRQLATHRQVQDYEKWLVEYPSLISNVGAVNGEACAQEHADDDQDGH